MSPALLAILIATWGGLLDVQTLPWQENKSVTFVADFDLDGRAEVAVVTGGHLAVYERGRDEPTYRVALPDGCSVIDAYDVDQDGVMDIVAVAGESIVSIALNEEAVATPVLRFSRKNQYSQYTGVPFPGVLVVVRDAVPLIALPCADALELRLMDGTLVDQYPVGMDAPNRLALGQPFSVWTNQYPQLGGPGTLEFRVSSVATYKPLLPDDELPLAVMKHAGRFGTPRQQRDALTVGPDRWPWFPVSKTESTNVRALYARTDVPNEQTAIRIRQTPEAPSREDTDGERTGPIRYYPGLLLHHPRDLPDFNGDGLYDLLLWKSRRISTTVDGLARAVSRGTWPVQIIAHAYEADTRRFSAKPTGQIALDVPLAWIIRTGGAAPIDSVFLHDIDGDGRTDFGCLTNENTVSFWRSEEDGFSSAPAFHYEFPEPIERIAFETDLDGQGLSTVALQSKKRLYLLRPDTTFTH